MTYKRKFRYEVIIPSNRRKEVINRFKTREEAEKAIADISNWNLMIHGRKPPAYRIKDVGLPKETSKPKRARKALRSGIAAKKVNNIKELWK